MNRTTRKVPARKVPEEVRFLLLLYLQWCILFQGYICCKVATFIFIYIAYEFCTKLRECLCISPINKLGISTCVRLEDTLRSNLV